MVDRVNAKSPRLLPHELARVAPETPLNDICELAGAVPDGLWTPEADVWLRDTARWLERPESPTGLTPTCRRPPPPMDPAIAVVLLPATQKWNLGPHVGYPAADAMPWDTATALDPNRVCYGLSA